MKMGIYKLVITVWMLASLVIVCGQVTLTPGTILVEENTPATLTCSYTGTVLLFTWSEVVGDVGGIDDIKRGTINPVTCSRFGEPVVDNNIYGYTCSTGNKQMSWTIKNIDRSNIGDRWTCLVNVQGIEGSLSSNAVSIGVRVPIQSVTMTKPNSDATVNVVENTKKEFICQTDGGLPVADITWYKDNGTPGTTADDIKIQQNISVTQTSVNVLYVRKSTLSFFPSRSDGDNSIYCSAKNSDNQTPLISIRKPQLNVIYGPDGPPTIEGYTDGGSYQVRENQTAILKCSSTGGNPLATLSWNCYSGQTNSDGTATTTVVLTRTWKATRNTDRTSCTCTSSHYVPPQTRPVSVNIQVLYPPSDPTLYVSSNPVSDTVKVIRGKTLTIQCDSSGQPTPTYIWTHLGNTIHNGKDLIVRNIQTSHNGRYTCKAENHPYLDTGNTIASASSQVTVEVLYGPEVSPMSDQHAEEGETFRYNCPYTPGNPTDTTVKWTRAVDRREWNSDMLEIVNVTKDDKMRYTCTVENTMYPTNMASVTDPKSGSFYLDVKYKASIEQFIVEDHINNEVDEFTSPTLSCSVDSNPVSNIKILFQNKTLVEDASTLQLKHQLSNVSCGDIGVYTCAGGNYLNAQAPPTQDVVLLVKCRPQPFGDIAYSVYSAQRTPATLSLSVLAYPNKSPSIVWKKGETDLKNNAQLTITVNHVKSTETYIDIIQLNLTIHNVTKSDFGQYKVMISNNVGKMEKTFHLMAEDIPESPTEIGLISSLTKSTEATIKWKPGFNGGIHQAFILLYKRLSDIQWTTIYVNETGDVNMYYTLTNLQSDTPYLVKIYARNHVGNSSISEDVIIQTLETVELPEENTRSIGIAVGCFVGGTCFAGLVAVTVIFLIRRHRATSGTNDSDTELKRRNQHDSDKTSNPSEDVNYYNIGRDVQVVGQSNTRMTDNKEGSCSGVEYETLNNQSRDTRTYSSLQPVSSNQAIVNTSNENKTYENLKLRVI